MYATPCHGGSTRKDITPLFSIAKQVWRLSQCNMVGDIKPCFLAPVIVGCAAQICVCMACNECECVCGRVGRYNWAMSTLQLANDVSTSAQ